MVVALAFWSVAGADSGPNGGHADDQALPSPVRIVSLVPSITETLFALGLGDRVVGVSEYCDFPAAVLTLPRVGNFLSPVAESVAVLAPDLIITSPSPGNQSAVAALERAGIPVAVVYGDRSVAEVRAAIARVAAVAGRPAAAQDVLDVIDAALSRVDEAVLGLAPTSVAVVIGREPLVVAGEDSYLGELIRRAGGRNIAASLPGRWPRVAWEYLVAESPEVIVDLSLAMERNSKMDAETVDRRVAEHWARFATLGAVRQRRVHGAARDLLMRPGPRIGQAGLLLAELLHPGAVGD